MIMKLDIYFVPKENTINKQIRFHQQSQKPGETVEDYIRSLHDWHKPMHLLMLKVNISVTC